MNSIESKQKILSFSLKQLSVFFDSVSFEDAVRNAVSLGADADTQACIAGAIAEAFYKEIPKEFKVTAREIIIDDGLVSVIKQFREKFEIKT